MDFLISLYDNSLLYYPNVFFAVLFFISILGIILMGLGVVLLGKKIIRVIEEIKSNLKQKKILFIPMPRAFFQRKSISFIHAILALMAFFVHMLRIFLIRINKTLEYIELKVEKMTKRIRKEIFIRE